MKKPHEEHPFYGEEIVRPDQKEYIEKLLTKYRGKPVTEELKAQIWDELQQEKHKGNITIPFKIVMRKDPTGLYPEFVEIILDTKV